MRIVLLPILVLLCFGCQSVTPIAERSEPPLVLHETEVRRCYGVVDVKIPAGTYEPAFRTSLGTYYICPTMMIWGKNAMRGGLFVAAPGSEDKRQGVWIANFGSKRTFRFEPDVPGAPITF